MEINYGVKVSVVIAVYNAEKYLPQALNSLINQTLTNIEIICVDDGSSDDSVKILDSFSEQDERIKVVLNKEQSDGAALARNIGISHASGECLIVLDSDDFFEKDMLEKAYNRLRETKSDMVVFNGYTYDNENCFDIESSDILRNKYLPADRDTFSPNDIPENLFQISIGAAWNILFLRRFVLDNKLKFFSFHFSDDIGFVFTAYACANKISILKERLIHYRINNSASQASNVTMWPETCYLSLLSLKEELEKRNKFNMYKISFAKRCMEYISFFLSNIKTSPCFIKLYQALQNTYIKRLKIDKISYDKFSCNWHSVLLDLLKHTSPEEFLHRKAFNLAPFDRKYSLSMNLSKNDRIVIYGAGEYGKYVFNDLFNDNFKIVKWVDKQYERMGYPVQDPESIVDIEFDVVIVTVIEFVSSKKITEYLLSKNVNESQICYLDSIIVNY